MRKKFSLSLISSVLIFVCNAQTNIESVFRFVPENDMFFVPWNGNGNNLKLLSQFVETHNETIESGVTSIFVSSYCMDRQRGRIMANRVKTELITKNGMKESYFVTKTIADKYNGKRNVVVAIINLPQVNNEKPIVIEGGISQEEIEKNKVDSHNSKIEPSAVINNSNIGTIVDKSKDEQSTSSIQSNKTAKKPSKDIDMNLSLRTNLLYWLGGLTNLGVEWNPAPSFSLMVNCGYAPWSKEGWKYHWYGWFVTPEVRYMLGESKQWYVGGLFNTGEYRIKTNKNDRKGDVIGGGITTGYKQILSNHFDIDYSLAFTYSVLNYHTTVHNSDNTTQTLPNLITRKVFIPFQLGVSLVWKID